MSHKNNLQRENWTLSIPPGKARSFHGLFSRIPSPCDPCLAHPSSPALGLCLPTPSLTAHRITSLLPAPPSSQAIPASVSGTEEICLEYCPLCPCASISSQHPFLVLQHDVPFLFPSLNLCAILCLIVSLCFVCLRFFMGGFMGAVTSEALNTLPHTPGLASRRHLVHYLWGE